MSMTGMNQFPLNVIIHPSAGYSWLIPLTISEVQRKEGTESLLKPRPLSEPSLLLLHPFDLRKSQSQSTKLRVKKKKKKTLSLDGMSCRVISQKVIYTERNEVWFVGLFIICCYQSTTVTACKELELGKWLACHLFVCLLFVAINLPQ